MTATNRLADECHDGHDLDGYPVVRVSRKVWWSVDTAIRGAWWTAKTDVERECWRSLQDAWADCFA